MHYCFLEHVLLNIQNVESFFIYNKSSIDFHHLCFLENNGLKSKEEA